MHKPEGLPGGIDGQCCGSFRGLLMGLLSAVGRPVGDYSVWGFLTVVNADEVVSIIALRGSEAGISDEAAEDGLIETVRGPSGGDDVLFHHNAAHVRGPKS